MAAYAALVSVTHIIDQLQQHPCPPISLDEKQAESLTEKVTSLQDFLERYSHVNSKEVEELEGRIADAAYAAEDAIESHIVDQIEYGHLPFLLDMFDSIDQSRSQVISSVDLHQGLEKVIENMDFIKNEAMEIKEQIVVNQDDHLHITSSVSASTGQQQKTDMVGFDNLLIEMMEKLTDGPNNLQIISIVGMGGSGKTTLARTLYQHKVVVKHFDILAWGTINSQKFSMRKLLVEILQEDSGDEVELKIKLYQKLWGRRYLIVLDDIWDIKVWDLLNHFFPDKKNGSRIIATTRQSNLAFQPIDSFGIQMHFLDENKSWDLFCKIVFGEEECPPSLKEIGMIVVENCRGLPLSIVVIGGVLAKYEKKREYWEYIAENLNSIVNLEDNEHCLKILYTSYNILPVHLKPCFLYTGIFNDDSEIRASNLIKLWIAEGFLKPIGGKSLEDVGEGYLKELIDRNLILAHGYTFRGRIKIFKIHDLLKNLCLREAEKHKFLSFNPKDSNKGRRILAKKITSEKKYTEEILHAVVEMA